jgi:hypothetical protein
MRVISETLKSTPLGWLPVLSNISPPDIRRKQALVRLIVKQDPLNNSMLSQMLCNTPQIRLKSRKPPWIAGQHLILTNFNSTTEWRTAWNNLSLENADLVVNPTQLLEGFKLPRQEWVSLNRIRIGHGRCGYSMHQWKLRDNPACDCGNAAQTIQHIVSNSSKRKFEGKMSDFFRLTSEALDWIATLDIRL